MCCFFCKSEFYFGKSCSSVFVYLSLLIFDVCIFADLVWVRPAPRGGGGCERRRRGDLWDLGLGLRGGGEDLGLGLQEGGEDLGLGRRGRGEVGF